MTLVRWRNGKLHISEDGQTTVCAAFIRPDRARIVGVTLDWAERVTCYNCAYRRTPPGYVSPRAGREFPLKKECPNHPGRGLAVGSCHLCDPSTPRPERWPCPNGCTDPADHSPLSRYTRCTVFPPRNEAGPDGRCLDGCESEERATRRANPNLSLDLAYSATFICYHCGYPVCTDCQKIPVVSILELCDECGAIEDDPGAAFGLESIDPGPDDVGPPDPGPFDLPTLDQTTAGRLNPDSSSPEINPTPPRHAGEKWTEPDHGRLVELLRNGIPLDDIAAELGRSVGAVASRCQVLLPPGQRVGRGDADLVLRQYLANEPDYDWRAGPRAEAARRGRFYWDTAADMVLREGWSGTRPLAELVAETGASELDVAARLVELGLATGIIDAAGRLGCEPGAALDVRVRMAADRAVASVWVLVADGLRGSERARPLDNEGAPKAYRHVSLHARADDAGQTLDRLMAEHAGRGGHINDVSVTLAERSVGDLAIGKTQHGRGATAPW